MTYIKTHMRVLRPFLTNFNETSHTTLLLRAMSVAIREFNLL